jgi:hypothetical protein
MRHLVIVIEKMDERSFSGRPGEVSNYARPSTGRVGVRRVSDSGIPKLVDDAFSRSFRGVIDDNNFDFDVRLTEYA